MVSLWQVDAVLSVRLTGCNFFGKCTTVLVFLVENLHGFTSVDHPTMLELEVHRGAHSAWRACVNTHAWASTPEFLIH